MKQLFLLVLSTLLICTVSAQQIEREMVVLEIATGTWCYYCPGAAMGADDMIENGDDVAVVEYHNGDDFANIYSNSRNNYYNVSGYPTATFDGDISYVGGSHNESLFNAYHARYTYRKDIPTSFSLDMSGEANGNEYTILLAAEKVADYEGGNLVVHLALTESDIQYNWQGMTEVNFVERIMVPDQYGTEIDFSTTNMQYVELNFTFDDEWVAEHSELVAFIQDTDSKEIQQGTKVALNELETASTMANFSASETEVCEGDVVDFSDECFGNPTQYTWVFEGGSPQMSNETNPSITYENEGTYDVTLEVSDGNSEHTIVKEGYITVENCTGVDEQTSQNFTLWPNPVKDVLFIASKGFDQPQMLKMFDVTGKLILQHEDLKLKNNQIMLDVSDITKGIYLVEITTDKNTYTQKVVIE